MHKRAMLALARMILAPTSYLPQSEKKKRDLKLHPHDLIAREEHFELLEAQKIMRQVLQSLGLDEDQLKQAVELTGAKWYEQGEEMTLPWTAADV
jgi:uncharacterized membrane protein YcaP (DUF421 family)